MISLVHVFAKNNRIIVGEKTEQNAPMTNQQKVDVAFSDDGTGTADYLIVDSYGYSGSAMILYHSPSIRVNQ